MSILIICGSKSDVEVMGKAADLLKEKGVSCKLRICSAHRTPELLDKILEEMEDSEKDRCQAIIAGAGLAAALPGVIASKTTLPVIGVPLSGAFEGLDALLSIMQMPPGIPVLTTGVNNAKEAAVMAAKIIENKARKVNLVGAAGKAPEKAAAALKELGIDCSSSGKTEKDAINIAFTDIDNFDYPSNLSKLSKRTLNKNDQKDSYSKFSISKNAVVANDALTIYCPTAEKETAADSLKLLQLTKKGVWVGLNRGENAAVAAAEILQKNNELKEYRWNMKIKVEEADREVNQ